MVGLSMAFALNRQRALAVEAAEHEATGAAMNSKLIDEDSLSGFLVPSLGVTAMAGIACLVWLAARRHYGKALADQLSARDLQLVETRVKLAEAWRILDRRRNRIGVVHRHLRRSKNREAKASALVRNLQEIQYILSKDLERTQQRLQRMKGQKANVAALCTQHGEKANLEYGDARALREKNAAVAETQHQRPRPPGLHQEGPQMQAYLPSSDAAKVAPITEAGRGREGEGTMGVAATEATASSEDQTKRQAESEGREVALHEAGRDYKAQIAAVEEESAIKLRALREDLAAETGLRIAELARGYEIQMSYLRCQHAEALVEAHCAVTQPNVTVGGLRAELVLATRKLEVADAAAAARAEADAEKAAQRAQEDGVKIAQLTNKLQGQNVLLESLGKEKLRLDEQVRDLRRSLDGAGSAVKDVELVVQERDEQLQAAKEDAVHWKERVQGLEREQSKHAQLSFSISQFVRSAGQHLAEAEASVEAATKASDAEKALRAEAEKGLHVVRMQLAAATEQHEKTQEAAAREKRDFVEQWARVQEREDYYEMRLEEVERMGLGSRPSWFVQEGKEGYVLSGQRGRANAAEVDVSAAANSASELVAGEAWRNESENATVVYVGDKGPLLLDDGFRRVLKLLSGDHGVSLFYNARAKKVRIKGMTTDVHETVVAILRTTLDSRLSQSPAFEAKMGPSMTKDRFCKSTAAEWKEMVRSFWADRGYVAEVVLTGDRAVMSMRGPREDTLLRHGDLILWGPVEEELEEPVAGIDYMTVWNQAGGGGRLEGRFKMEDTELHDGIGRIRAPKAALRYFFRTGIVESVCAESAKTLGAVSAGAEEAVRGWVDWSMCLVELKGPIPQVAHAFRVILRSLNQWKSTEAGVVVDNNVEKMNGDGTSAWLNALSKTVGLPLVLDVEGGIGGVVKTTFVRGRAPTAELAKEATMKMRYLGVQM